MFSYVGTNVSWPVSSVIRTGYCSPTEVTFLLFISAISHIIFWLDTEISPPLARSYDIISFKQKLVIRICCAYFFCSSIVTRNYNNSLSLFIHGIDVPRGSEFQVESISFSLPHWFPVMENRQSKAVKSPEFLKIRLSIIHVCE
jgi:hypothetical protein